MNTEEINSNNSVSTKKHELNEIYLMQYERMQRELIYELNYKRSQLEKVEGEFRGAQIKITELDQMLSTERRKYANFEKDFKAAIDFANELEKERIKNFENYSQMKINNEFLTNENAILKEKLKALQSENEIQKKTILDLETHIRCHKGFQNDTIAKVNQTESLIALTENTTERLINEQQKLKDYVEEYILSKSQLEVGLYSHMKLYNKVCNELKELKSKYISLSAELDIVRKEKSVPVTTKDYNKDIDSLMKRITQLRCELEKERNVNTSLMRSLESMKKEFSATGLKTILPTDNFQETNN